MFLFQRPSSFQFLSRWPPRWRCVLTVVCLSILSLPPHSLRSWQVRGGCGSASGLPNAEGAVVCVDGCHRQLTGNKYCSVEGEGLCWVRRKLMTFAEDRLTDVRGAHTRYVVTSWAASTGWERCKQRMSFGTGSGESQCRRLLDASTLASKERARRRRSCPPSSCLPPPAP